MVKKITSPESVSKKSSAAPKKKSVDGDVSKGKGSSSSSIKDEISLNVATDVQASSTVSTALIDTAQDSADNKPETPCSNDKIDLNVATVVQLPTTVSTALLDSPQNPDNNPETPCSNDKIDFNITRDVELSTAHILLNL